eukprot:GHUV01053549.1.p1 GENE.GHUV01053549.1~~GHUV01053549.1.p1  ORF type:complete len:139 (+),score=28.74 GHUV01053549.1:398-814(+)
MISDDFAAGLAQRPRILVCAPSNAAIDELLERILRGTFRDVHGNIYRPDVVRLGSEEALSSEARQVWVDSSAADYCPASYATEHSDQQQAMRLILTSMRNIADTLSTMQKSLCEARAEAAEASAAAKAAAAGGETGWR